MGFCKDNCRKEYHKYGGAYRKLLGEIAKEVTRQVAKRLELLEPCEVCKGKGFIRRNGKKTLGEKCEKCNGLATRLTQFGREVLDLPEYARRNPALT